jgi:aspartate/methionine/tyrosine aminotransferase
MNASLALPEFPDFARFTELKRNLLSRHPDLVDVSETRLVKALRPWLPNVQALTLPLSGHRCHVAEHWLSCFGLPAEWKRRALVTNGVRHSLACLFKVWARHGRRVLIPGDVYPVYLDLAKQAGCSFDSYSTFPCARFDGIDGADIVLVTDPTKPRNGELTTSELCCLREWLGADTRRRVVIDAVYTFDARLSDSTMALYATGQTIVLHSLSKGWGSPLMAGVALVPPSDVDALTPAVRALEVNKAGLRAAQAMLSQDRMRPMLLRQRLHALGLQLRELLAQRGLSLPASLEGASQYLFVLDRPWETLLEQHHLLALPYSVFGSTLAGHSVVSSLPPEQTQ